MRVESLKCNWWYLDLLYFINVFLKVKKIESNKFMMGILGLPINLLLFKQNGKTILHACIQPMNEILISHSLIFNQMLQSEHRNHSYATYFIWINAIYFPRQTRVPPWKTVNLKGIYEIKFPYLFNHLSSLNLK